ncbi:UPF0489 family protein [Cocleimonas flava]|nr:UPF0489 family protein [Cocleimonas flava]
MKEEWILPFKGRNVSTAFNQNFLWKKDNIYIMDNHRAALWCWLEEISVENKYNLFHIDAHYDTRTIENQEWVKNLPDLTKIDLQQYLDIKGDDTGLGKHPAITWDNYLSLFYYLYPDTLDELFTATHLQGTKPDILFEEVKPYFFIENTKEYLSTYSNNKWIINLDLDYFFSKQNDQYELMYSDTFIEGAFQIIKDSLDKGIISVLTICLSPECCGGWEKAESLCSLLTKKLEIDFTLPPNSALLENS